MNVPLLHLDDVAIGFGTGPTVLESTTISVQRGEFLTLIGPSGCGKSTVLNVVAGLLPVRHGSVTFDGHDIRGVNTAVGYMTQDDTLLPWRTVRDNVAMPLKLRHVDRAEVEQRVTSMLMMLDLSEAVNKYPAQLSGGMKRRALLARSMIYQPELLLMDEPFAALDAQLRGQLHLELRRAIELERQSVLFITHDIYEAVLLSDRVIVLGGRPSRPIGEVTIPFGSHRDLDSLRFDDTFIDLERQLHDLLGSARTENAGVGA